MKVSRIRILGSTYVGMYAIANDTLAFVPEGIEEKALKNIESTLDVKAVKTAIYESSLLAVFAKMNNKFCILPSFAIPKEIENIEKEIKVKIIKTEQALGNLIEMNDYGAIISKTAYPNIVEELKKDLKIEQTNIGKTDATGSAIAVTNNGFAISHNATEQEINLIEKTLNVKGGSSTANTGDSMIRNSLLANKKGFVAGEATTGFELNRIEEALEQKE